MPVFQSMGIELFQTPHSQKGQNMKGWRTRVGPVNRSFWSRRARTCIMGHKSKTKKHKEESTAMGKWILGPGSGAVFFLTGGIDTIVRQW